MNTKFKKCLDRLRPGGIGALLSLVLAFCLFTPIGRGLRNWSYDLPFLLRYSANAVDEDVAIIYLDEKSYKDLNQKPCSFDRALHADLLRRLKGAKVVVFDVLFIDIDRDPTTSEADTKFAKAIADIRADTKVVLGVQYYNDYPSLNSRGLMQPVEKLLEACTNIGLVEIQRDTDFEARLHHFGTDQVPSLAWKAAELAGAEVTKQGASRQRERWLNYHGRKPVAEFSYSDVIQGGPTVADFSFRDKIVFIGSGEVAGYTGDKKEQYRSPWTWLTGEFQLGVEVHAVTFSNLMHLEWLRRLPRLTEFIIVGFLSSALGYILSLQRPAEAVLTFLMIGAGVGLIGFLLPRLSGWWFPWLLIVVAPSPSLVWSWSRLYLETERLRVSLERYVSTPQAKRILNQPDSDVLKPGTGALKLISILFTDIAAFSKIAELKTSPKDVVRMLNEYYELAIPRIHAKHGTVMNLYGDSICAIWNALEDNVNHAELAVRTALVLDTELRAKKCVSGDLPMSTRIGLHSGDAFVGNVGSAERFTYTAIGESVNAASRLEGLNKHLGTTILASREIYKACENKFVMRFVGRFRFKGFIGYTTVYEPISLAESEEVYKVWLDAFHDALSAFEQKRFDVAKRGFEVVLLHRDSDEVARFYRKWIDEISNRPPLPGTWMGEIDLEEK